MNVRRPPVEELISRLNRLRRVAPGALRDLGFPGLSDLRAEVIALPEESDPLRWLRENRAEEICEITFRAAISSMTEQIRSRLAMRLLEPVEAAKFNQWHDLSVVGSQEASEVLERRLHDLQLNPPPLEIEPNLHPLFAVSELLLKKPSDVAPVDWIFQKGLASAEMVVLGMIANLSLLPPDLDKAPGLIDRIVKVSGLTSTIANGARLTMRVERFYLHENGFTLPITITHEDQQKDPDQLVSLDFRDIDTVRDDLGAHYMPASRSGMGSLQNGVLRWELAFYRRHRREAPDATSREFQINARNFGCSIR